MKEVREEKAKVRNIKKRGDAGLMKRQTEFWDGEEYGDRLRVHHNELKQKLHMANT